MFAIFIPTFAYQQALKHSPVATDKTEAASHVSPPSRADDSPSAEDKPAPRREQRDAASAATTSAKELDIASFLSVRKLDLVILSSDDNCIAQTGSRPSAPLSEDALMEEIMQPHATMCGILSSRLTKVL